MKSMSMVMAAALCAATPVMAQEPARPAAQVDRSELRHHVYVMEGALAAAVEFGAQELNREIRSVMPDVLVMAGQAQARGVYLDGYGIYFDVQVPVMRQSMMWSLRMMLDNDQAGVRNALGALKRHVQTVTDPAAKASLETAINRLELQVGPMVAPAVPRNARGNAGAAAVGAQVLTQDAPPLAAPSSNAPLPTDRPWIKDPNRAYTEAVQRAIVGAMIDYSAPMMLGADEWLTVAARDGERRDNLAPQNPAEEIVTVLLQIKGADLAAYRAGRIDREEARRRVVIREF